MTPIWLEKYLDADGIRKIESTTKEAEKNTSGEIVPMIVHRSSTVGHVPIVVYISGLLLYYILDLQEIFHTYIDSFWWSILIWSLLWVPVTLWLSKLSWVQRSLVNQMDREDQSEQRAMNEFYMAGLNKTDGSTGVLLFVSIVDHQAVVLADKSISDKLPSETWTEVIGLLIQGIRTKKMAKGMSEAIEKCGQILEEHFPIAKDDTNELPNKLIIKE